MPFHILKRQLIQLMICGSVPWENLTYAADNKIHVLTMNIVSTECHSINSIDFR